jgi:alkylated DNA repair protein (DNA oxidative demethylase)
MARAPVAPTPPEGLVYQRDFLDAAEEDELLGRFDGLDFQQIVMKGVATAVRYGHGYDYDTRTATPDADPIPPWLVPSRDRAAALAGLEADTLVQDLIQRYPPRAPIGWHRDSPAYDLVAGVSLGSAARMRLRRGSGAERVVHELLLEPRSAYVLAGESRWKWEHHVPAAKELRYSITFRSLRSR